MIQIQAPQNYDKYALRQIRLFIAGGITGCPPWQSRLIEMLSDQDDVLVVFNPRRENFDVREPNIARTQIEWEHHHLGMSNAISFWFPKETLCPITLYELGAVTTLRQQAARNQGYIVPLFIGIEPGYQREIDVRIQTELRLSVNEIKIADSLEELADQIKSFKSKKDKK